MNNKKLSLKEKLGFGICDLGGNALFTIMAFWLMNYLTDTVGLAAGLAGTALMIGKVWDAITDPLMGYISDRTRTRWGRRRPYIFSGGILVFAAMAWMFTNPRLTDQNLLFYWAVGVYCFLNLGYTILNIPYSALTPELTSDYNERTILNGYRMSFAVIGTLIGAGAVLPLISLFPDRNIGFSIVGILFGLVILIVSWITFFTVKEPPLDAAVQPKMGILRSYGAAFKNMPFLLILFPWVLNMIATTIVSGMLIYYFKYIYHAPESTTLALLIMLLTAMVFIPIWVFLSKSLNKKNCYAMGMIILALTCMIVFFSHGLGVNFGLSLMFLAGIGLATTYVFPWAIIPDTIEYGYIKTGERHEGVYYGLWTLISKTGQALAALLMGLILDFYNYLPNEPIQAPDTLFGIRLLFGPIPAFIFIIAAIIVLFYPIDAKGYQELTRQIST
ncbi:MAG: MFS transporter [Firmicutes bacterium]|nr:MFS transporter [Bacillota bacterium]